MELLYKVIVGSFAYGTYIEGVSDFDYKGIYQQSPRELLGYGYIEQNKVTDDEVYFEIKRFLELAETANPTILELLYMPEDCILNSSPILNVLFENRDKFLTKKCKDTFNGYVRQQIKKAQGLDKKQNWEKSRVDRKKSPIEFCYVVMSPDTQLGTLKQGTLPLTKWLESLGLKEEQVYLNKLNHSKEGYQLYLGNEGGIVNKDGNAIKTPSSPADANPVATVLFSIDAYRQHAKEFESYQIWLRERNEARYVDFESHGQSFDGKNLLHCRRLLNVAAEIATQKTINVRRSKEEIELLLSIRRGQVNLEDILNEAKRDVELVDEMFNDSGLPETVDENLKEEILWKIRGV